MSIITPYIDNLERMKNELPEIAKNIITENAPNILYMIKYEQIGKGIDYLGNDLIHPSKRESGRNIPLYEPSTENYYANKSPRPRKSKRTGQRYNFEWSGDMFDGLELDIKDDGYNIFSKNGKKEFLEGIYQTKLTIFTEDHNNEINNLVLLPNLYKYILDNLLRVNP